MKVRLYQFAKRNNSTKRPAASDNYVELECRLKEPTTMLAPVMTFQTLNPSAYNYMFVPSWNRYYFITDVTFNEGMYEVSAVVDTLGSYKNEIGATPCNILYATGSTKNIVDSRLPVKADVLLGHSYNAISGMTITEGSGAVILGITGKGSFGSYLMQDSTEVAELLDGIDSWSSFITDNWTFTKQLFFGGSASECLRSAIAIPLVFGGSDVSSGAAVQLSLGNYPCVNGNGNNINGYKITKPILKYTGSIDIPWQSGDWKKTAGYTTISLYLPFIGLISIPATEVMTDSALNAKYAINVTSGDISVEVYGATSARKLCTASGNCAMNTAYGSTGINTSKLTSAVVTGVGTLISMASAAETGGLTWAAKAVIGGGIAATAGQTIGALGGSASGSGGLGGGSNQGLDKVMHCFVTQKQLTDTQSNFDSVIGKPFMGVSTPGSFNGFVQTDGFEFQSIQAYSSEKDTINSLMDSGIYFE